MFEIWMRHHLVASFQLCGSDLLHLIIATCQTSDGISQHVNCSCNISSPSGVQTFPISARSSLVGSKEASPTHQRVFWTQLGCEMDHASWPGPISRSPVHTHGKTRAHEARSSHPDFSPPAAALLDRRRRRRALNLMPLLIQGRPPLPASVDDRRWMGRRRTSGRSAGPAPARAAWPRAWRPRSPALTIAPR